MNQGTFSINVYQKRDKTPNYWDYPNNKACINGSLPINILFILYYVYVWKHSCDSPGVHLKVLAFFFNFRSPKASPSA